MAITGGNKMAIVLADIDRKLKNAAYVRVGFLENAKYPDGKSVAMIAAIQEFGAPKVKIPPRPFFRNMIAAKKASWGPAAAARLKANNYDVRATLNEIGDGIAGQLRQSIRDTMAPALSPVTIMLRKMRAQNPQLRVTRRTVWEAARRVKKGESTAGISTKPLVDSGHLFNSVSWEIR